MPRDSAGPVRDVESLDRQTTRPVAPDGDRRPRHVWRRRRTGADREAHAEPAAPDQTSFSITHKSAVAEWERGPVPSVSEFV